MAILNINNRSYSDEIIFASGSNTTFDTTLNALNTIVIEPNSSNLRIEYKPKIMFEDTHYNQSFEEFDSYDPLTNQWTFSHENTQTDIRAVYIHGGAYSFMNVGVSGLQNARLAAESPNYFCLPSTFYTPFNTFIIEPLEGFVFVNPPTLIIRDSGNIYEYDFVLQDDKYYISAQFPHLDVENVEITGIAVEKSPLLDDYGLIRVYKTNKTINQSLSTHRFYNNEDLGQYIYSFVKYPFEIETENNCKIYLGTYDTAINAPLIPKQIYKLSLGKKLIKGVYEDTRDIDTTEITVILPFYGLHSIDTKYINTEIEIIYVVDILSNTAVIELYSNGVLFDALDCYIGYSIPYIIQQGYMNHNITLQNNITKKYEPQIILKQHKQINGGLFSTYKPCVLGDVQRGFVKCVNVVLSVSNKMTLTEQKEIVNKIQTGIII